MYLARQRGGSQRYLSKDTQMDEYLEMGWDIYSEDDDTGEESLVATPEKGFLVDRPAFPKVQTFYANKSGAT